MKDKFNTVEESNKTKKAREKLKKKLKKIDDQVTDEALTKKTKEIHLWIARHSNYRKVLNNNKKIETKISLFDENQSSAKLSKYVNNFFQKIKNKDESDIK